LNSKSLKISRKPQLPRFFGKAKVNEFVKSKNFEKEINLEEEYFYDLRDKCKGFTPLMALMMVSNFSNYEEYERKRK